MILSFARDASAVTSLWRYSVLSPEVVRLVIGFGQHLCALAVVSLKRFFTFCCELKCLIDAPSLSASTCCQ
jgi:hypothetical protein